MSYIDKNLLGGETILFRTKKHLIIFLLPVLCTLFAIFASVYLIESPILQKLNWIPWLLVLIFWGYVGILYLGSDYAVTNKRVMMREGFFHRHTNETRIATVSQVNVNQSIIGQIFNYGTVSINAFGAFDSFTLIAKPIKFQQQVNDQLDKVVR